MPVEDLKDSTKDALEAVAGPARRAGLEVEFSGGVVSTSEGGGPNTEAIGVIVAFFVLLPDLDIEGEKALHDLEGGPAAEPEPPLAPAPTGGGTDAAR